MPAGLRLLSRLIVLAIALTAGAPAWSQSVTASLTGMVRTQEGTGVPDVVIHALSEATGSTRVAVTDSSGRYRIDLIQPGIWTVWAEVSGGITSDQQEVQAALQQTVTVDFTVGPVLQEKVVVTAEPPIVDTRRTGGELRLDAGQTADLPLAGRVVTDLALLDSSVMATAPGNFTGEVGSVFTVNGQSGRANSFLVDGLDNNDQTSNTNMNSGLSQVTIREFVVKTRQYLPEYSRASGAILNIITERGGNDTTGQFFFQGAAPALSETGDFVAGLPEQPDTQDTRQGYQAGFSLGGPLARDRAFYFASYERLESDDVIGFAGIDRGGNPGGRVVAPSRNDNFFFRNDFNLGGSQLMARISVNDRKVSEVNVSGRITPEHGFLLEEQDFQIATSLTTVISPRWFNEARLLYGTSSFEQFASSDRPGVTRPSGSFGGNNLNEQIRDESRLQLVENVTWLKGDHSVKFGFDLLRSVTDISTAFHPNGTFLYETDLPYEPGDCGNLIISQIDPNDPFAPIPCPGDPGVDDDGDGIVDEPGIIGTYPIAYTLIDGQPSAKLEDTRIGLFVQDSWQLHPDFLLDYGLRYDLSTYTLPRDAMVESTIPNGGAGRDTDNIAPRLGFAWSPGGKRSVLRGGAGIFYDKLVLGFPAVAAITSGTEIGLVFPQGLTLEITEDVVEELGIDAIKQVLIFPDSLTLRFSTGTEMETPYTVQYSLGYEHRVGSRGAWSAMVTRALGYNIPLMKDLNPVVDPQPLTIPVHEDPDTGSIAAIVTEGRSWYTALDLGWRWQGSQSWYRAGYTWSKSIDEGPDPLKGTIGLPPSTDFREERARSDSDRRHRFALSGATRIPWWGGLKVSGIARFASGLPFNVTTGGDENLDGIPTDRPEGVKRNSGEETSLGIVNEIRRDAGLEEIEELEEPEFIQVDLRVAKPLLFRDGRNPAEVYFQVFNLFNRFNPGLIEGSVLSEEFGEPISAIGPPRTVELGLRILFGQPSSSRPTPELRNDLMAVPASAPTEDSGL